jgi:hypothetical protein
MKWMIKSFQRAPKIADSIVYTNVYDYSSGGGGGPGISSPSRLTPASDVGFSSSGNTIGVLNTRFVPYTITEPTRILLGLPTSTVLPDDNTTVPLYLSVNFSTSSDVNIVTRGSTSVDYFAGSSGFYFRNELKSDYYFMLGYLGGRRTVYLFSVPINTNLNSAVMSSIPGFTATFGLTPKGTSIAVPPGIYNFNQAVPSTGSGNYLEGFAFQLENEIVAPIGTAQKLSSGDQLLIGEMYNSNTNNSERKYRQLLDVKYICFA